MNKSLIRSSLVLFTVFGITSLPALADLGDVGTVIENETVSVITGDGNTTVQTVKTTNRGIRYYDTQGNDGTVIRNRVTCDVYGNNNVCDQYSVVESQVIRGARPTRPDRNR